MKFSYCLWIFLFFLQVASAEKNGSDRYALPPSKVYIKPCSKKALILHPGVIENVQVIPSQKEFSLRLRIRANDKSKWLLLCSLTNGNITSEQKLIE
jgi:hypothetical protein